MSEKKNSNAVIKPRTLAGFRDIMPEKALAKEDMIGRMKAVFRRYGYAPIETPHLEYTEMLIGQSSEEIGKQLYRFSDNGGRDVTLRFDLTVPLARYAVQHANELGRPFKRYAVGSVFRGESPQAGRYREFTQCDFDCIGSRSVASDAEIILMIHDALLENGLDSFTVAINTRKLLEGILQGNGAGDFIVEALRVIDKIHKIGRRKVSDELANVGQIGVKKAERILDQASISSRQKDFWEKLETLRNIHPLASEGIDDLLLLEKHLNAAEMPEERRVYDLSIARGLGYYTGVIFETTLDDMPDIGSICSGGRYDNLTRSFSLNDSPGVGASFGIDRLQTALESLQKTQASSSAKLLVAPLEADCLHGAQKLAANLRKTGVDVELFPDPAKIAKHFAYAERKGIRYLIAYGGNEYQSDSYIIADLSTGEKKKAEGFKEILAFIKASSS